MQGLQIFFELINRLVELIEMTLVLIAVILSVLLPVLLLYGILFPAEASWPIN